jgi:hypothetical protein
VPSFLDFAQDQAAASTLRAPDGVLGASGCARIRDLRASVSALCAACGTVIPVSVLAAALAARHTMQAFPAGMGISAAVLPFEPLKLKDDPDGASVEIEIPPAQPECFTLSQAKGKANRPAGGIGPSCRLG